MDVGAVLAMSWLMVGIAVTGLLGPDLGLRGWAWLGLHDVLCVVGSTHELVRSARRRARR